MGRAQSEEMKAEKQREEDQVGTCRLLAPTCKVLRGVEHRTFCVCFSYKQVLLQVVSIGLQYKTQGPVFFLLCAFQTLKIEADLEHFIVRKGKISENQGLNAIHILVFQIHQFVLPQAKCLPSGNRLPFIRITNANVFRVQARGSWVRIRGELPTCTTLGPSAAVFLEVSKPSDGQLRALGNSCFCYVSCPRRVLMKPAVEIVQVKKL